ncbi:MAG TPA: RNA polymerase sigma factor [Candidatus Limnocylindrales bacterium]|nr:RNA polymerase sigma factor [Candidatus Limnocylindrales bacterium]
MASGPADRSADRPPGGSTATNHQTSLSGLATSTVAGPAAFPDDRIVVQAVLDGDRDAFRILVDRELAGVVRAAARVLDDVAEAEDVAQETFVIAYRSLASWRADGPFGAWLARIAIRLAVRRAARLRVVPWAQPGHVGDDDEPRVAVRQSSSDPEHAAVRGEQAMLVRRAVAALDEPYREVVALRFFADRSLDEIATLTGRPLGTVKTHLRRGLLRLRAGIVGGGAA